MTETLMVKVSPALKAAIKVAADKETDGNVSEFMRGVVAQVIGYDLSNDAALDGRGRPQSYESEDKKVQRRREQERVRQQHRRAVIEEVERQARLEGARSLEEYLRRKGITVEADAPANVSA